MKVLGGAGTVGAMQTLRENCANHKISQINFKNLVSSEHLA